MKANYPARVALLAALYILTGELGLLLAVPPGYATIIWPASGIAIGMLLANGARLWPGVLIGSLLVNAYHSGVFGGAAGLDAKLLAAVAIAVGSTIQALAGRALVARFIGLPLRLSSIRQLLWLFTLAGPLTCAIASTIGVGTLYSLGIVDRGSLVANWSAWWSGDTLGVLVFMPIALLAPGNRDELIWRDSAVGRLPLAALLLLMLPLGLTFYAWKAATENDYQRGQAKFETLTHESENALQNRVASYSNTLLGIAGFMQGSHSVSREEWRTYVETLRVHENFPGILGVGWVSPVAPADIDNFQRLTRADGAPEFAIHPLDPGLPNYVITYVEPLADNREALGLNLAFESERLAAADLARDSGTPAITRRITLVQDQERSAGFLMLYPVYYRDMPTVSIDDRRAALRGWAYAALTAKRFLDLLTIGQKTDFRLSVYDGDAESAGALIYDNGATTHPHPAFSRRISLRVLEREWLLVWRSTPDFERAERSTNPLFILVGGLTFTALLALLLVVIMVRRTEHLEQILGERRLSVPLLVFLVIATGSSALYSRLRAKEREFVVRQTQEESSKIESLLRSQLHEQVLALSRIASRWRESNGIPYGLWRRDAAEHVAQLPGLRAIEWIDPTFHVKWIEPVAGNETALGLDVTADPARGPAVRAAAGRSQATLTPPLRLAQGYVAFIVYHPLSRNGLFDGFLAGVFSIDDFFRGAVGTDQTRDYTMAILHDGNLYFTNTRDRERLASTIVVEHTMLIEGQSWTLRIAPTNALVASETSALPQLVLVAGLLVGLLSALSVRYLLIARLKSAHLTKSLALNAGIISSSAHLVIAIDEQYRIMIFNRAAEQALGYRASEVIGRRAIPIFMDPAELEERARTLSEELGEQIPVGPDIFTRIPLRDGLEKREWTFVRKDRTRFPVNVIITPLREDEGRVTGYLGVIEDITLAREMDRMKSEFTAVVSHELRTPLTSIRGSLGLILGALSMNLPPKVRELLEIAQSNCERLVLMINDILDIEKFSAGQMRFDIQTLPLADILRQAVQANEGYARKFNVRIETAPLDDQTLIAVDPDRFIQVMSNLLSNALKYSPARGTVRVSADSHDGLVRVCVHDEGPGIPEKFRARLFEKFSQADTSATRSKGGTGLGLHIARRFVEHMHGRIGFESEVGTGSTFWVEFPIVTTRSSAPEQVA